MKDKNNTLQCCAQSCTKKRYVGEYCFSHHRRFTMGGGKPLHIDETIKAAQKFTQERPRTIGEVSKRFWLPADRAADLLAQAGACPVYVIGEKTYYSGLREDAQHTISIIMKTLSKYQDKEPSVIAQLCGRSEMTVRTMLHYLRKCEAVHVFDWDTSGHHHIPLYRFGKGRNKGKPRAMTNKECNDKRMMREKNDTNLMMDRLARQRRYYHRTAGLKKRDIAAAALFGDSSKSVDA
ncbi:hypothetical protein [Burkholderia phage BCSR52]|uniref:Uncharacterized protein n=1 Tax=Burkholderia phage BCSR52 TaxID=2805748 RepID=A0A889IQ67_9CAUD|nr:hypothetical protein [Burkholderia phage BCSR52]